MYVRLYLYEYIIIQLQLTQIYNVNTLCLSFCKARAITSVLGRFLHVTALHFYHSNCMKVFLFDMLYLNAIDWLFIYFSSCGMQIVSVEMTSF